MEKIYEYIESVKCMNDDHNHIHHVKKFIEPGFVDLGLPSGTLWAKYNLGVNPKDLDTAEKWYGNFYAWGELSPKSEYWGTPEGAYKWGVMDNTSGTMIATFTKYNCESKYGPVDNKIMLEAEDDIATVTLGYEYRIPTCNVDLETDEYTGDMIELLYNTDAEWVTNYDNVEGLNGLVLVSIHNGNHIFIPAAGGKLGVTWNYKGTAALIQSSSLFEGYSYYCRDLASQENYLDFVYDYRCTGLPVRPVKGIIQ